jgi:hypothetical protein
MTASAGVSTLYANAVVGDTVAGVVSNVVGGVVTRAANGEGQDEVFSPDDVADDAVAGFVGGYGGHVAAD